MKRILVALGFLAALISGAPAQSSKATLNSEVSTNYPDNTTGAITPAILRSTTNDMIASWQQATTVNAQAGTTYAIVVGDYGKLVTLNNASPVAVSIAQATGSFATFNVFVKNLGAGTVTITPTTSTINGSATFTLTTGNSAQIISDGTNYQVWGNIGAGTGSVTSVATGTGLTGGPITSSGTISCITFTSLLVGCVPASGGGSSNFLRSDGSWTTPAGGGTVTSVALALPGIFSVSGSPVTTTGTLTGTLATQSANTIWAGPTTGAASAPTFRLSVLADLPSIANNTVLGNVSGGSAAPSALSAAQLTTLCNTFTSLLAGCVPASGGGSSNFLRSDGTWTTPAGGGTVTSVATGTGLSGGPITTTGTISLSPNIIATTQAAKTTTYAVQTTDCGSEVTLAGAGNFYAVTVGAASGFPSLCRIRFTNIETWAAPGGKSIQINGYANRILWPGVGPGGNVTPDGCNSIEIVNLSSAWIISYASPICKLPSGAITFNYDPVNGTDTVAATDGLGLTTRAFKTAQFCINFLDDQFRFNATNGPTQLTCKNASGAADNNVIHFSPSGLVGATGGNSLTVDLNGGSMNPGGPVVQCYFGAVLQLRNGTIGGAGTTSAIAPTDGCKLNLLDGLTVGSASVFFSVSTSARLSLFNNITVTGNGTFLFLNSSGGQINNNGETITAASNMTLTSCYFAQGVSYGDFSGGVTFSNGGHTISGTRFDVEGTSSLAGSAAFNGLCPTAGTTSTGGQAF